MNQEQQYAFVSSCAFLIAFILGSFASYRLRKRYVRARPGIEARFRPILQVMVIAAWLVTITAGWVGSLSMVRLLLRVAIPWTPPITITLATIVVLIPVMFDAAVTKVVGGDSWVNQLRPSLKNRVQQLIAYFTGKH